MVITDFKYFRPKSLMEALALLEQSNDAALMAGGTDLLVEIKKGLRHHENIISLSDIEELKALGEDGTMVHIGAAVTHNELVASPMIREKIPALSYAAAKIGSEQIRNKGTVGGNICTAASCCDLGPVLVALEAVVEIKSSKGKREVPLKDFFIFHRRTVLAKGELVTRVSVPIPKPGAGVYFEKFGLREAAAVSVASVAARVRLQNGVCEDACIVIGAVAPTPKISQGAVNLLLGKSQPQFEEGSALLDQVGNAAAEDAIPIDDIRGGATYRRDILKALTRRAVTKAIFYAQNNPGIS